MLDILQFEQMRRIGNPDVRTDVCQSIVDSCHDNLVLSLVFQALQQFIAQALIFLFSCAARSRASQGCGLDLSICSADESLRCCSDKIAFATLDGENVGCRVALAQSAQDGSNIKGRHFTADLNSASQYNLLKSLFLDHL